METEIELIAKIFVQPHEQIHNSICVNGIPCKYIKARYCIMFSEVFFDDMSNMTMKTNNSPARTCEGKNMKTAELVFNSVLRKDFGVQFLAY